VPDVTFVAKALPAVLVAGWLVAAPAASPPHYTYRDVAFVTITGHGSVHSVPHGIACPRRCRVLFPRGTHLRLRAAAAPGWRFAGFAGKGCRAGSSSCAFDLVTSHDCVGGACPTGAFGVRARFVRP
jgi:hypothetical protein